MPFNPKFTITPKINNALVEIERVRGFLDAVKLTHKRDDSIYMRNCFNTDKRVFHVRDNNAF